MLPTGDRTGTGGLLGSIVSRYFASCTSSMRAPFSEIEPISSGVVKVTRGVSASASGRPTTGCCPGTAPGPGWTPGVPAGVVPWPAGAGGAPGCVEACCVPLTGGLAGGNAACQPTMISTDSTMARMKFF